MLLIEPHDHISELVNLRGDTVDGTQTIFVNVLDSCARVLDSSHACSDFVGRGNIQILQATLNFGRVVQRELDGFVDSVTLTVLDSDVEM